MASFPHLALRKQLERDYRHQPKAYDVKKSEITIKNLANRAGHSQLLYEKVGELDATWKRTLLDREKENLPELPHPDSPPLFLQVDVNHFDIESLISFGIEIIAEKEDGFVVGASTDNFKSLRKKIDSFASEKGRDKDQAAKLWQIVDGSQWRVNEILSEELQQKWPSIKDTDSFTLDISIACYQRLSKQPARLKEESDNDYENKLKRWSDKVDYQIQQRDEHMSQRQSEFEKYLGALNASLISSFIEEEDSFGCRVVISGKGLRDLTLNYPHIFDIAEQDELESIPSGPEDGDNVDLEILAPNKNAPKVCVIDSGIQENHKLIQPAIDSGSSRSFLPNDTSVSDQVNDGHGTKVAGAILFPDIIPRTGRIELPFFIQNARVLDGNNAMPSTMYPPELMQEIVDHFTPTRIFNLSIATRYPCRKVHMSQWASAIDRIMHEENVLFIVAAGNIHVVGMSQFFPGIKDFLANGINYPKYLLEASCRIANPAQSSFALSVGSVCIDRFEDVDRISFGMKDFPSAFSRTGLGLWGMIKPDVVEYGGDWIREKNTNPNLSVEKNTSPELVKTAGGAFGRDAIGTSFSAPKVSHIAGQLQRMYEFEDANLYRALIVQSARLPGERYKNPQQQDLRHFGYGIPDLDRATGNTKRRVTLIATAKITAKKANVYSVRIPEQLRRPGDRFSVLVEVCLAYTAQPRRTRRRLKSYLSTWLSWESSKLGESLDQFQSRVLKGVELDEEDLIGDVQGGIPWLIREQSNYGKTGLRRHDNSIQKSWCILESNQLSEEFSIAVVGHRGWNVKADDEVPYALTVSFEALESDIELYELIQVENEIAVEQEVEVRNPFE